MGHFAAKSRLPSFFSRRKVLHQEIEARHAETKSFKLKNTGKIPTPPLPAMKLKAFFSVIALASAGTGFGQYATDPVGVVSLSVPAQADVSIGAPMHRASEFQGRIKTISGSTLTVVGTPGWTTDAFKYVANSQPKTYFVRVDSGTKEGLWCTVTANSVNSITVNLNGESFSGVNSDDVAGGESGDLISVIPFWTPKTLFGSVSNGVSLLLFRPTNGGINVSATSVLTYQASSGNWFNGFSVANDSPIFPTEGVVLRNSSTSPLTVSVVGTVPMATHRAIVKTIAANTDQDQRLVYQSPVPDTIGNIISGFTVGDALLFFNNSSSGINKSASNVLTWNGSAWFNGFTNVSSSFTVNPGTAFVFRKKKLASPTSFVWQDLQGYLLPN